MSYLNIDMVLGYHVEDDYYKNSIYPKFVEEAIKIDPSIKEHEDDEEELKWWVLETLNTKYNLTVYWEDYNPIITFNKERLWEGHSSDNFSITIGNTNSISKDIDTNILDIIGITNDELTLEIIGDNYI